MKSKYFFPLCLLSFLLCSCHFGSQKDKNLSEVKVLPLEEYIAPYQKEYIGVLKPIIQVVLRSRVEGFLEQRLFKEGDFVKKDDLLFIIDKKPFEAQLLSAKGNLEKAKADLAFQEVQLKRYQQLVVNQNVSKSQYDQQYAQYLQALGSVDVAQGNYDQALLNLGYCSVFAPISGLAGKAYVDIGNLVTSGASKTDLVKLVQLDPIRVEFNPSVSDVKKFLEYRRNKPFAVEVSLPKFKQKKWNGVVDFYDNEINLSTSTLLLRQLITLNDSDSSYFQTCSQDVPILKKETNDILEFLGSHISQIEFERGLIFADIESLIYKIQTAEMSYCFEIYEEMITDYPLDENYQAPLDFHLLESNIKRIIEIKNAFIEHFNPRVTPRAPLAILENPFATEGFDYFIDLEETCQTVFKLQIKFNYFSWEIHGEFENLMLIQFLMNHMKKRFIMEPEIIGPNCSL